MTMLPRLEAQRELANVQAMGAAFGGMRPIDRRQYFSRLRRIASGARAAPVTPQVLASMGVGVVVVPAEASNG